MSCVMAWRLRVVGMGLAHNSSPNGLLTDVRVQSVAIVGRHVVIWGHEASTGSTPATRSVPVLLWNGVDLVSHCKGVSGTRTQRISRTRIPIHAHHVRMYRKHLPLAHGGAADESLLGKYDGAGDQRGNPRSAHAPDRSLQRAAHG